MMNITTTTTDEARAASGDYSDEVLDAGWLPRPDTDLTSTVQALERARSRSAEEAVHAEHFLEAFYRNQE
jgi:hypothetical protein